MFQGCSGVVPGCSGGVPGVFRGVPGCSRVFRGVPGVFRVLQTPHADALDRLRRNFGVSVNTDNNDLKQSKGGNSRNAKPQVT